MITGGLPRLFTLPLLLVILVTLTVCNLSYAQPSTDDQIVDLAKSRNPLANWFRSKQGNVPSPYDRARESSKFLTESIKMKELAKEQLKTAFDLSVQTTSDRLLPDPKGRFHQRILFGIAISAIEHKIAKKKQRLQHPAIIANEAVTQSIEEKLIYWEEQLIKWQGKKDVAFSSSIIKIFNRALKYELIKNSTELYFIKNELGQLEIIEPKDIKSDTVFAGEASASAANGRLVIRVKHNRVGDVVSFVQGGKDSLPLDWQRQQEREATSKSKSKFQYTIQTLKELFQGRTDLDHLQARVLMMERVKMGSDTSGANHWVAWEDSPMTQADALNQDNLDYTPKPRGKKLKARLDATKNYLWAIYESPNKSSFNLGLFAGTVQGGITGMVTAFKLGATEQFADLTWMQVASHQATLESTGIAFGFGFFFGYIAPFYKNWRDLGSSFTRFVKNAASTQAFSYWIKGITADATAEAPTGPDAKEASDTFSFTTKEGLENHGQLTLNMSLKNWLKVSLFDLPRMRFIVGVNDKPFELKLFKIAVNVPKIKALALSNYSRSKMEIIEKYPELKNWFLNLEPEARDKVTSMPDAELEKLGLDRSKLQKPIFEFIAGKSIIKTSESAYTIEGQLLYTFVAFTLGTIHVIFPSALWMFAAAIPTLNYIGVKGAQHYAKLHPDNVKAQKEAEAIVNRWDSTWGHPVKKLQWWVSPYGGTYDFATSVKAHLKKSVYYFVHPFKLLRAADNKIQSLYEMLFYPKEFWAAYYENKLDKMSPDQRKKFFSKINQKETVKYQKMMTNFHNEQSGIQTKRLSLTSKCTMLFAN